MDTPPLDLRDIDPGLLDRYLAGEATAAEVAYIEDLIATHAPVRLGLARLRADLARATDVPKYSPAELAARARAMRTAGAAMPAAAVVSLRWGETGGRRGWAVRTRRMRAAIAIGFGMAAVALIVTRLSITAREYTTGPGQRETITLADGTGLTLGPSSRLRLSAAYRRGRRREVILDGEAYFVVAHDDARPFVVYARRVRVSDIGTRFDVRAYAGDTAVRVVVADGAVAIGAQTLHARDMATVGSSDTVVRRGIDVDPYLRWRTGELAFNQAPMRDVVPELDRWYGITVRLADSALAPRAVTASFKDETAAEAIHAVAATLGATAHWQGRVVTLSPQP